MVVVGAFACQMGLGFTYMYGPLLPEITADLGWNRATFNSATAPRLWVQAMASPVLGLLVARVGGRAVLVASAALLACSAWGLSNIESAFDLLLWNLVLGLVFVGVGDVTVGHVVAQWVERSRALALGIVYVGSNIGGVVVLHLVTQISEEVHWREAFLWTGIAGALFLLPFAVFFIRSPRAGEGASDGGVEAIESGEAMSLRAAVRTRTFWILFYILVVYFFFATSVLDHLVSMLMDQGIERTEAAGVLGGAVFLGVAGKLGLAAIAGRMSPRVALSVNMGMVALSSVLIFAIPWVGNPYPAAVLFGLSYAGRDVVYPLVVIHVFGVRSMAPVYGTLMATLALGGVAGPVFTGAVRDQTGSYTGAFAFEALLMLVAVALIPLVRRELGRSAPAAR